MRSPVKLALIEELREKVEKIEGAGTRQRSALPFGVPEIDSKIPSGGLALNAVHELAGGGHDTVYASCPSLFVAGITARLVGEVIWCLGGKNDLFAPALVQVGLHHNRVIFVESDSNNVVLECAEEALRFGGLAAVVAEASSLDLTASRRLQLYAEKSGVPCFIIRRWRRMENAKEYGQSTSSMTKWRISSAPSEPLPVDGVGQHRWLLELMRSRGGECGDWLINACDQAGHISLARSARDHHTSWRETYG